VRAATPIRAAVQVLALCALFAACQWLVARSHLPLPPGLLALGLLLVLLLSRAVPEERVGEGADALLRMLGVLFVPAGIAVIRQLDLLRAHGLALAAVLVISLVLGQLAAGLAGEWVGRAKERR
jgi:holin-like protein